MNIQLVAFGFGCLLLMVAILGGGFEVKELKVPKVGRAPRFAACLFGVLFVFIGIKSDLNLTALAPHAAAPQAQNKTETTAAQPAVPAASVPAPAPIVAGNTAPQSEVSEVKTKKARPAATSSAGPKKLPWEQKPRRWLERFKAARG